MARIDVLLPQFGMGMQEAEIIRWTKAIGDEVTSGESLVEIEAAKTTAEVPSPGAGRLVEILAEEGETVPVRSIIARIEIGE